MLRIAKKNWLYIPVIITTFLMIFPFLWSILLSFKTNTEIFNIPLSIPNTFNLINYKTVFRLMDIPLFFKNSFIIAASTVLIQFFTSLLSSYALARLKFKSTMLQNWIYYIFLSGFAIPIFVLLFPIYMITGKLGLLHTYISLILPYAGGAVAFNTLLLVGQLKGFPKELEESAVMDGCGLLRTLFNVVVPVIKPTLATLIIFQFIWAWNEFPLAAVLIIKPQMNTVSLSLMLFKGLYDADYGAMVAAIIMIVLPQLAFYAIFQKHIIEGMVTGAVKG